ncbi:KxYKxGKxW signal peptide domain-containing protein [Amylolactobacillus amylophilus]
MKKSSLQLVLQNEKVHFKLHKSGKTWLTIGIAIFLPRIMIWRQ